jgi:hypothetical protein
VWDAVYHASADLAMHACNGRVEVCMEEGYWKLIRFKSSWLCGEVNWSFPEAKHETLSCCCSSFGHVVVIAAGVFMPAACSRTAPFSVSSVLDYPFSLLVSFPATTYASSCN